MKLVAVLCLVGLAAASPRGGLGSEGSIFDWESGKTYVFKYNSRQLTGFPGLAAEYSGLGLESQIHLSVQSSTEFSLSVKEARYVRVNDKLQSRGSEMETNWRNLELPEFTSVPSEYAKYLEIPTIFQFEKRTGEFLSLVVSGDEPEWCINFKKALVSLIQTKIQDSQSAVESNKIESGKNTETFWKIKEQSIDGVCEVMYQLNEVPSYMIKDLPRLSETEQHHEALKQVCKGQNQHFELVKTKDVSSCEKRSSFTAYKPGYFRCPTGNCDGMWSRSSITRYIACGSVDNLKVVSIFNEGELYQNLLAINTENILTGTKQTMKLVKVENHSEIKRPHNPKTLKSLLYTYKIQDRLISNGEEAGEGRQMQQQMDNQESQKWATVYKTLPRNMLLTGTQDDDRKVPIEKIKEQIKHLLKELVEKDLVSHENIAEKQITMNALNVARGFSLLTKKDVETVYDQMKSEMSSEHKKQTLRNVFFDTLIMSGTEYSVIIVKKYILSGEITPVQSASILLSLPHYLITPTHKVMEELYELVTSSKIKEQPRIYNHAIMSYTVLLEKACVADNRKTSYPTFVFGEFCQPDSDIVVNKWIPFLQRELCESSSSEMKNVIITSLGLLSHRNVISILVPVIEQTTKGSNLNRFLAIYSLAHAGRRNPELTIPIVFSVFSNRAESTEVRVAAFNTLLKLNPPMAVLHKIAAFTWSEKDIEILKVVYTAFFSLKEQREMEPLMTSSMSLQRKAAIVFPLMKPVEGVFPSSGTIYSAEYLKDLNIGFQGVSSWTSSKDSIIPTEVYTKMVYLMDRYTFTPIEIGARIKGFENVVEELVKIVSSGTGRVSGDSEGIYGQIRESLGSEWKQVIDNLRIKAREGTGVESLVYINLMENAPIFMSLEASSSEMIREKIVLFMENPSLLREKFNGENEINYQRVFYLAPSEFMIPSDMGFPILIEFHMPLTFSLRGKMNVHWDSRVPSVKMNVKTLFASQYTGWVGTICPFTEEFVLTGADEHSVVNLPADFSIDLNVQDQKLKIHAKVLPEVSETVDLLHFHVRPFMVYQKNWDLTPMTLSHNIKFINSQQKEQVVSKSFGDYLGLSLKGVLKTESPFANMYSFTRKMRLFNLNPLNLIRFSWANTALNENEMPSIRKHEYKLQYNPTESHTREIEIIVATGCAIKNLDSQVRYHAVRAKREGEGGLPFEVREVTDSSVHPKRQEMVRQTLEKMDIQSGVGVTFLTTIALKGSRTRSLSYALNLAGGAEGLKQKWSVTLESETTNKKVCVNGMVHLPNSPMWRVKDVRATNWNYYFKNVIGFGQQCTESQIKIEGTSKVSEEQKEWSRESPEARELYKIEQKSGSVAEFSEQAEQVKIQASTIDEIDYRVEYQKVPRVIMQWNSRAIEMLKGYWWAYLKASTPTNTHFHEESQSDTENVHIKIHPRSKVFDLTINRRSEMVKFQGIRIPYPFTYFFPTSAIQGSKGMNIQSIMGKNVYPECRLHKDSIQTFGEKTIRVPSIHDQCYHLLAADCSENKRFGVMVRSLGHSAVQGNEVKIFLGRTKIVLTPGSSYSSYNKHMKVVVDDSEISLVKDSAKDIKDKSGNRVATAYLTRDNAIVFKSTILNIQFDGEMIDIKMSPLFKRKTCGICGSANGQIKGALVGPQGCVYSKPEIFAASYRVEHGSENCKPLPKKVEQELIKENEECATYKEIPTKVTGSFKAQAGECTVHRHEIIEKSNELCFSKVPLTECGAQCRPAPEEGLLRKDVDFTCMEKNRMSYHYVEKIRNQQVLRELKTLPTSFSLSKEMPRICVPVHG
eukprot:TCALIF_13264-PA protein Name:"Similar to Vg Vitellogenin (Apis mellifera)" AED:0.01 eAED:0.01 QI:81/1/0.6/1/1/0.8/5/0/1798